MHFNGGTVEATHLTFGQSSMDFSFGGMAAGSVTITNFGGDRHSDSNIDLDFLPDTQMSLTLTAGTNTWAKDQWDADRLKYNGQSSSNLGKDWAAVTASGFSPST